MQDSEPAILITGASDGLGLALARHYAKENRPLVLLGRRAAISDDPLFTKENYLRLDLARADCGEKVLTFLRRRGITRLALCVHNAGMGYYGPAFEQSPESIRELVAVNLGAPLRLTRALLPFLIQDPHGEGAGERSRGKIVFISSVMSSLPCPHYSVYGATKAALDGFARNLRIELGSRAPAVLIRPGAIRTDMHKKLGMPLDEIKHEKFPPAESVARDIASVLASNSRGSVIGFGNKVLRFAGTNLRGLFRRLMRKRDAAPRTATPPRSNPYAGVNRPAPACLITGAADGLGLQLARNLAAKGYYVVGVDKNIEKSAQAREMILAEGGKADFLPADLSKPSGTAKVLNQCTARKRTLGDGFDIVIHNAGISSTGAFAEGDDARHDAVVGVNLTAPMVLTAGLLKEGLTKAKASFVFLSSLSYFASYPGATVYGAAKDGIAAYARSMELESGQAHFLTVFPGPLRTAMAREHSPDNSREHTRMSPEEAAQRIVKAIQKRKRILIPGGANKMFAFLGRYTPSLMENMMKKLFYDKLIEKR